MVEFGAIIGESAGWTKKVLFKPFSFKKWMVLTFIALLAGSMSNGCNFNSGGSNSGHHYESQPQSAAQGEEQAMTPITKQKPTREDAILVLTVLGSLIVFFGVILILFTWLGSRFSFVFLEDIVNNDASIKSPFSGNAEQGNSYFKFNIAFLCIFLAVMGLLIFLAALACVKMGIFSALNTPHPDPKAAVGLLLVLIPFFLVLMVFVFIVSIISVIMIDLVLPIMYKEKIKILAAWGKAWALVKKNVGNFAVYILIKIGLGIGAGLVYALAFIICFIIVLIPVGLLGLAFWLLGKVIPVAAVIPYWIVAGLILTPICLFLLYCLIALNLPFAVFFRTYSLKFLERLDPQYALIKTEKPVAA